LTKWHIELCTLRLTTIYYQMQIAVANVQIVYSSNATGYARTTTQLVCVCVFVCG